MFKITSPSYYHLHPNQTGFSAIMLLDHRIKTENTHKGKEKTFDIPKMIEKKPKY
uniref:Uncharacterized protein n=1 Tax=Rhizophora mucronata TaxID=61149 RepID=A0A2P2MZZ7_RHIMU